MKILDTPGLSVISRSLTDRKLGSSNVRLNGSLEVFACSKRTNISSSSADNSRPRARTNSSGNVKYKTEKKKNADVSPVPTFEQFARTSQPETSAPSSSIFSMELNDESTTYNSSANGKSVGRLLQAPSDREAIGRARAFSLTSTANGLDDNGQMLVEARSRSGTLDSLGGGGGNRSRSGSVVSSKGGGGGSKSNSRRGSRSGSLTGPRFPSLATEADRLRTDFIGILNETWGDFDFSGASLKDFHDEKNKSKVIQDVNVLLAELTAGDGHFLMGMWSAVEDAISLSNEAVEVYSYQPEGADGDPFSEPGNVWSINYFFFNKDLKAILYFTCVATRRHDASSDDSDDSDSQGAADEASSRVEESEAPSDYYMNSDDEDAED